MSFRKLFHCSLLLLALGCGLMAQTKVAAAQIDGGAASPAGKIFVVLPNGVVAFAELTSGVSIDMSGPTPVLRAISVREIPQRFGPLTAATTTFTLTDAPIAGSLHVYVNGLLQHDGLDYTLSGLTVTFLATATPGVGSIVQLRYRAP